MLWSKNAHPDRYTHLHRLWSLQYEVRLRGDPHRQADGEGEALPGVQLRLLFTMRLFMSSRCHRHRQQVRLTPSRHPVQSVLFGFSSGFSITLLRHTCTLSVLLIYVLHYQGDDHQYDGEPEDREDYDAAHALVPFLQVLLGLHEVLGPLLDV